jgi:Tfp pilus assembly protein PilO
MALVSTLRVTGIIQETVKPENVRDRAQYTEIPYTVEAHGRYHELGQFLTLIEQNPQRFMRVKSFKLGTNLLRPSIHPIKMEITTFMFNN